MRTDDIFAIASMTKPIVTIAILQLVEEGRLRLSDPVERYLPEFREPKVSIQRSDAPNGQTLVPATRSITILDLLTHRAGLPGTGRPSLDEAWNTLPEDAILDDWVKVLARLPLVAQPGAEWEYGPATDVLGRIIEVVSGRSLDVSLHERILEPLKMVDTSYVVPTEKRGRMATIHKNGPDGRLVAAPPSGTKHPRLYLGSNGLYSTAGDYLRFCQMLLDGGELDGHRLVSRKAIELMTTPHVDSISLGSQEGQHFGLNVAVQGDNGASGLLSSPGTFGWSGSYNTYFRIDPKEQLILVLMVQQSPTNLTELRQGFQNVVMQTIAD